MKGMSQHAAASALASKWVWMSHAGSTNDELVALARAGSTADVPDFTVVATDDQRN